MARIPKIAARLAPIRSCISALCLRSAQVKSVANINPPVNMNNDFIITAIISTNISNLMF
jgi:hypothetical protein